MSTSIRDQIRTELPEGWWRSARWWGSTYARGIVSVLVVVAPALLLHQTVHAVLHRNDPAALSRHDPDGHAYGLAMSSGLAATLVWSTAGIPTLHPVLFGMGAFIALDVAVAGTALGVLAASAFSRRNAKAERHMTTESGTAPK